PDDAPELADHANVSRLPLYRLAREGVEAIVRRLGGERLPESTVAAIVARTDGIPLFVEELTKAVVESGETTVPATLHDTLMAPRPHARGEGDRPARRLHRARVRSRAARRDRRPTARRTGGRAGAPGRRRTGVSTRLWHERALCLQARPGAGRSLRKPAQEPP